MDFSSCLPEGKSSTRCLVLLGLVLMVGVCGAPIASPEIEQDSTLEQTSGYYTVLSQLNHMNGFSAVLKYNPPSSIGTFPNPGMVIQNLQLVVRYETSSRVRITILDLNNTRWRVPIPLAQPGYQGGMLYDVDLSPIGSQFELNVTRVSDGKVIFYISAGSVFQYVDDWIILTNSIGYPVNIFGLGERVSNFPLNAGIYTLFSRDNPSPIDNGAPPGKNLYGAHPFYLAVDSDGSAFGGFLLNSNAMDVNVTSESLTFNVIGGVIDYWAFVGPTPETVISQYHGLIGYPTLVPYWSLGWHQCRWGWHNVSMMWTIFENYMNYNIPLDVLWNDIDYMDDKADFTVDPVNFAGLPALITALHAYHKQYVPILDAGIAQNSSFYTTGVAKNVFILNPYNLSQPFIGVVWPGNATFVDWFNPNASSYWTSNLKYLQNTLNISFDGLWLDMNEVSNFCVGECFNQPVFLNSSILDYVPGETDLNTQAIDLGAGHYGGLIEFDTHSLYGYNESFVTSQYFTQVLHKRPFIISRSTFPSQGNFSSHWLGDNWSAWIYLQESITGIFNFHMFGIPMVGADVCGFLNNTTEELCSRWMQVGALYPFSRNHNNESSIDQYPWSFTSTLLYTSNYAIRVKYSLLNYFYSYLFQSSLQGGTWWKPTFFNYPSDPNLIPTAGAHFMIGDALLVHPVLQQGVFEIAAYFPDDIWYNYYNGTQILLNGAGTIYLIDELPGVINIHVRGGYIIPQLDAYGTALTTAQLRISTITLIIATDGTLSSNGFMYLDDGLNPNTISTANYTQVLYSYNYMTPRYDTLVISTPVNNYVRANGEFPSISTLLVLGCLAQPSNLYWVQGTVTTPIDAYATYDLISKVCSITLYSQLQPDVPGTVLIDYFGPGEATAESVRAARNR